MWPSPQETSENLLRVRRAFAPEAQQPKFRIDRQPAIWNFFDRLVHDKDGVPSAPKAIRLFALAVIILDLGIWLVLEIWPL